MLQGKRQPAAVLLIVRPLLLQNCLDLLQSLACFGMASLQLEHVLKRSRSFGKPSQTVEGASDLQVGFELARILALQPPPLLERLRPISRVIVYAGEM